MVVATRALVVDGHRPMWATLSEGSTPHHRYIRQERAISDRRESLKVCNGCPVLPPVMALRP